MKCASLFALFCLTILFSFPALGQSTEFVPAPIDTTLPKPEFGFKLGANFQSITSTDWVQTYNTGVVGGFFVGFHKNKIGVNAEILVSTTGYKTVKGID